MAELLITRRQHLYWTKIKKLILIPLLPCKYSIKAKNIGFEIINLINCTMKDVQKNGLKEVEAFFKTIVDETNLLNGMVAERKTHRFIE